MILYDRNGITVAFSEEKLEITTAVMHIAVEQQDGTMTTGEKLWRFCQPEPILSAAVSEADNNGRSIPYVCLTLNTASGAENWTLYPDVPFICTDHHPDGRIFRLPARHIQITSVELVDKTDHHDSLVKTDVHQFYKKYTGRGNLFLLEDIVQDSGLLLVKHAPCPGSAVRRAAEDLLVDGNVHLRGCGYVQHTVLGDRKICLRCTADCTVSFVVCRK